VCVVFTRCVCMISEECSLAGQTLFPVGGMARPHPYRKIGKKVWPIRLGRSTIKAITNSKCTSKKFSKAIL